MNNADLITENAQLKNQIKDNAIVRVREIREKMKSEYKRGYQQGREDQKLKPGCV